MRSISLFFSLLLAWSCWAQPAPINRRAFALSGLATSTVIPDPSQVTSNIFRWWVASDVTNGVTVSNQWVDRIVSEHMDQLDPTKRPTNSAIGMYFVGTTFVTNGTSGTGYDIGALTVAAADALFFIIMPDTVAGTARYFASDKSFANRGPRIVSGDLRYQGLVGAAYTIATLATSNHYDVVAAWSKQDSTHFFLTWYTNGVPVNTNGTSSTDDMPFNVMGGNVTAGDFGLHGYLLELGIYTNNPFVTNFVPAIHKYATNKYGYTP